MDSGTFRPILSGLLGGTLAIVFCRAMSRWVPDVCNGKEAEMLLRENRAGIWLANIAAFSGLIFGIAIYRLGWLPDSDWRGFAIGAGGGILLGLVLLSLMAGLNSVPLKEAYVAFAISQKTPIVVLGGILAFCAVFFTIAVAELLAANGFFSL